MMSAEMETRVRNFLGELVEAGTSEDPQVWFDDLLQQGISLDDLDYDQFIEIFEEICASKHLVQPTVGDGLENAPEGRTDVEKLGDQVYLSTGTAVPLKEWAKAHGLSLVTARQRAARGAFNTARKVGRDWIIDFDEELIDHRFKGSS